MQRRAALAIAIGAAAGAAACEATVELTLIAPAGETTTTIDYGCVTHVEATAIGADPTDVQTSCVPVDDGAIRSLRDHDLSGLISLGMPRTGLRRVVVRGIHSFDDDCNSDDTNTIFYGQDEYHGGDQLGIPLHHSLDCADLVPTPTPVRALTLDQLLGPAANRCDPLPRAAEYSVAFNHIYPRGYGEGADAMGIEPASAATTLAADGTGSITGPHFAAAEPPSCLAVVSVNGPVDEDLYAVTCFDPALPTLCAPAGTAEAVFYDDAQWIQAYTITARNLDGSTDISLGLVYDAVTRAPIAGATAVRRDERTNLGLSYLSWSAGSIGTAAGQVTDASGLFAIEGDQPITVLVSADGYQSALVVLAPSIFSNASRMIPLRR